MTDKPTPPGFAETFVGVLTIVTANAIVGLALSSLLGDTYWARAWPAWLWLGAAVIVIGSALIALLYVLVEKGYRAVAAEAEYNESRKPPVRDTTTDA
ncbi:MAG: hypothetical protein JWP35_3868 [Caulobacter sp.]|nr:hypothetical protein [Caulobacter sp.]